jgi:hypothetical protein
MNRGSGAVAQARLEREYPLSVSNASLHEKKKNRPSSMKKCHFFIDHELFFERDTKLHFKFDMAKDMFLIH